MSIIRPDASSLEGIVVWKTIPGGSPPGGGAWETEQESSKRQQCVRATELAGRTGLVFRYAGLWTGGRMPQPEKDPETDKRHSGKDFDGSGRTTECMNLPGLLRHAHAAVSSYLAGYGRVYGGGF